MRGQGYVYLGLPATCRFRSPLVPLGMQKKVAQISVGFTGLWVWSFTELVLTRTVPTSRKTRTHEMACDKTGPIPVAAVSIIPG